MKSKEMIGFRIEEEDQLLQFEGYAADLEVSKAELAREAFKLGLPQAVEKVKAKKLKETQSLLERLQALQVITSLRLRLRNGAIC